MGTHQRGDEAFERARALPAGAPALGHLIEELGDPLAVAQRIAEEAMRCIPDAHGASVELMRGEALHCVAGTGILGDLVGGTLPVAHSLAGRAVRTGATLESARAASDARVDRAAVDRLGVGSLVCVPMRDADRLLGAMTVAASFPHAFSDRDVATLAGLSSFLSAAVSAAVQLAGATAELASATGAPAGADDRWDAAAMHDFAVGVLHPDLSAELDAARRVERVLVNRLFHPVYQPILDATNGRLVMAEVLSRFECAPYRPPDDWFADAWRSGLGADLEIAALCRAAEHLSSVPSGVRLAVNLSPPAISHPELAGLLRTWGEDRVVIELTEHVAVDDYDTVRRALGVLRERGVQLAIDDTGAGFASLSHIVQLAPDIIKLDRGIVHRVDDDPVRRSLASAIVAFAADIGARVVAESIETPAELDVVRSLGIDYVQGLLLGAPGPVEDLAVVARAGDERRAGGVGALGTAPEVPGRRGRRGPRRLAAS